MKNISDRSSYKIWITLDKKVQKEFIHSWKGSPSIKKIIACWDQFDQPQTLWTQCFPNTPFNNSTLTTWLSSLKKALERYLTHQYLDEHSLYSQLFFIRKLKEVGGPELLRPALERMEQNLRETEQRDTQFYRICYLFCIEKQEILLRHFGKKVSLSADILQYKTYMDHLEYMEWAIQVLNDTKLSKVNEEKEKNLKVNHKKVNEIRRQNQDLQNPLLEVFLHFYDLLQSPDYDTEKLEQILLAKLNLTNKTRYANFHLLILNHSIQKAITDPSIKTLQSICNFTPNGIEKGFFTNNQPLDTTIYLTLIRAGMFAAQNEQMETWANRYLPLIPERDQKAAILFTNLCRAYKEKDYASVIALEHHPDMKNVSANFFANVKFILLESYLFLENLDKGDKLIRNIRLWINRNKLLKENQKNKLRERLSLIQSFIQCWNTPREKEFWEKLSASKLSYQHRYFFLEYQQKR
ncbi:MAG: hypothetical protein AAFP89_26395 [Bacteroidota bacterium]